MAKKKEFENTVSVTEMDKYIKDHKPVCTEIDADGMKILVKPYITAAEYAMIVTVVSESVFDVDEETGETVYNPYFKDLLIDSELLDKYTNISLPASYFHKAEIAAVLTRNGIMGEIMDAIGADQIHRLRSDIHDAIEYKKKERERAACQSIVYIGDRLRALTLSAHDVMNKINNLADAIGDEDAVKEFIDSINESVSSEGEDDVKYIDGDRVIPIPDRK